MSDHAIIHLLVVDRSLSDIERIAKALRGAGYTVQAFHSDQATEVRSLIEDKPLDLIVARQAEALPTIADIRAWLEETGKDVPILALVDKLATNTPIEVLRAGAANCFHLPPGEGDEGTEHLTLVASTELRHLAIRRQADTYRERVDESEARFRTLLDSSRDAIAYTHEGAHIYANRAYLSLFGYDGEQDLEGITLVNMVIRGDRDKLKAFLRRCGNGHDPGEPVKLSGLHRDGSVFPVQMEGTPTRIGNESCLQIVVRTSLECQGPHQDLQRKLEDLRQRDALTGLYNRRYFTEHLNQARIAAGQEKPGGAVLYILLTNYRSISERLGLEAVEQLTIDLAKLLRQGVAEGDIVARFSDAVFTVHTFNSSRQAVLELGERICAAIEQHASHAAQTLIATTACVGICMVSARHENATQILANADRACETARQMGGNQVQIYSAPSDQTGDVGQEEACAHLIQEAVAAERLGLLYQPIASLRGDTDARYKVYLRIPDENGNPLPLRTLVPLAERRGLMNALDRWVIVRGLEVLAEHSRLDGTLPTLFVRISRNSVTAEGFRDWLDQRLKDTGLPGSVLVIEVAEDCAEQYFKEVKVLREHLRRLGCGFALCHFGGRSNSGRILQHLTPDYIKLDSTLIEKLAKAKDDAGRQAMAALTEQARTMRTPIVADGVATAPQMASIWQFGVALVQGDMVQEASAELGFDFQQFAA